jgi:hypothetical protein
VRGFGSKLCALPNNDGTCGGKNEHYRIADTPDSRLITEPKMRLEKNWKCEQTEETASVARCIKHVWILRCGMIGLADPSLKERCSRSENEERCADTDSQQAEQPRNHVIRSRWNPSARNSNWKRNQRDANECDVDDRLSLHVEISRAQMCVEISEQQHRLEIHEACIPNRRRSAEERKNELCEERLYPEKEEGRRESREREES